MTFLINAKNEKLVRIVLKGKNREKKASKEKEKGSGGDQECEMQASGGAGDEVNGGNTKRKRGEI